MSADDTTDERDDASDDAEAGAGATRADDATDDRSRRDELTDRLSEETDRAVEEFDQRLVDLLSWMLDTETRARIYVHLRQSPHSTSDEIAEGTGLYPSTVREALAELHDEGIVERRKRQSEGAGNNPYEYAAIAPSELVGTVAERVQTELNTVFNLDRHISAGSTEPDLDEEPVTITVEDGSSSAEAAAAASTEPAVEETDETDADSPDDELLGEDDE
ncbi:TrmB family transcription regulator [Salinarchaeum sp. Harcht-Bsk1]|uniref:winged helix-turn-helix domain-containing protein n=1 Tax=Salinarchaeum sp. Harcht-Bsk1 TaxID=1333523 RepID=UPI00034241A9|nr:winged helix-turn-helix domain-containing protein [Salinarchaeum sp. Harcht-Bsk1]AGN01980.1 TrmB family transcription regulator [Salinarchaeum sp. Harcht-Bsk1]